MKSSLWPGFPSVSRRPCQANRLGESPESFHGRALLSIKLLLRVDLDYAGALLLQNMGFLNQVVFNADRFLHVELSVSCRFDILDRYSRTIAVKGAIYKYFLMSVLSPQLQRSA